MKAVYVKLRTSMYSLNFNVCFTGQMVYRICALLLFFSADLMLREPGECFSQVPHLIEIKFSDMANCIVCGVMN